MSSNMYGFECSIPWQGRTYDVQVVYVGTVEDIPDSLERATEDWESTDPADLAAYEIEHRDWTKPYPQGEVRITVWGVYGGWLPDDPASDPSWNPPQPTEREVLEIIASQKATDIHHGWDT